MTLEDAIRHLQEVIPEMECSSCKDEHIQLLGWLKELKNLKEAKECSTNRWKPGNGEVFWFLYCYGDIRSGVWGDSLVQNAAYNSGNCFRSREEAEAVDAEKVEELLLAFHGVTKESELGGKTETLNFTR